MLKLAIKLSSDMNIVNIIIVHMHGCEKVLDDVIKKINLSMSLQASLHKSSESTM